MSFAATETMLAAGLKPAEGVESLLLRHMARASHFADHCFDRAEKAEVAEQSALWLRLATQLSSLFSRTLDALHRHRERARKAAVAAYREKDQARFDHVLGLAAMADAAVKQKAKRGGAPASLPLGGGPVPPAAAAPPSGEVGERPLSRQQRRAAERRTSG